MQKFNYTSINYFKPFHRREQLIYYAEDLQTYAQDLEEENRQLLNRIHSMQNQIKQEREQYKAQIQALTIAGNNTHSSTSKPNKKQKRASDGQFLDEGKTSHYPKICYVNLYERKIPVQKIADKLGISVSSVERYARTYKKILKDQQARTQTPREMYELCPGTIVSTY